MVKIIEEIVISIFSLGKIIGAGLATIGLGLAAGVGIVFGSFVFSLSRNPFRSKGFIIKKCGLFPIILLTENPEKYQINFDEFLILSSLLFWLVIFLIIFRKQIHLILYSIFIHLYTFSIIEKIVHNYCYFMVCIKGLFEMEFYLLPYIFIIPNGLFIFDIITNYFSYFDNPLYLGAFFVSIGIFFISLDELASLFVRKIENEPNHFLVINYLKWYQKKISPLSSPLYHSGLSTVAGKLTAAGQSAIYGGILALTTGIAVASIHGYSSYKGQSVQAEAATAQAKATAEAATAQAKAKYDYKNKKMEWDYKNKKMEWDSYNKSWNPFKRPPK